MRDQPMRAIWNTCLFLFITSFAVAQHNIFFKHITTNEGLSQSTVTSILQDDEGFMWFGTQDGLNKFDGSTVKVYKNDPLNPKSISHNLIQTLFKDRTGNIWIGSGEGGLIYFDREKDSFKSYQLNPLDSAGPGRSRVDAIEEDSAGNLWIGTYGGGLNFFDIQSKKITNFKNDPLDNRSLSNDYIKDLLIDRRGKVWVATFHGGLNCLDPSTKSFKQFKFDPKNKNTISRNDISKIFEDSDGNLWAGTDGGGINLFNADKSTFTRYTHSDSDPTSIGHNDVLSLDEDLNGNLWVGTRNGGISILHRGTQKFTTIKHEASNEYSLNNNSIYSLFKDKDGNMWVGTYSGGVNFASAFPKKFKHYKNDINDVNSLSHNNVLSFMEDHAGNLWIGTDGGGLNLFKRDINEFTHYRHKLGDMESIRSDYVLKVFEDSDHTIWTGNFKGGLSFFNKEENKFTTLYLDSINPEPYKETVGPILEDKQDFIWVGTYGTGISRYDKKLKKFKHFSPDPNKPGSISDPIVLAMHMDSKGRLWAGTAGGGLNVLDEQTNTFTTYRHDKKDIGSISSSLINVISEDIHGNIWIGTNGGLNLFHPETQTFTSYHEKDGMPNDVVYGIQQDDHGNLWLSTSKGLSKFNPESKKFRNYDLSDGLQGNSFNRMAFFKNNKGELFFGGFNGFNVFHPDSLIDNNIVPPVYITNFEIFNKTVSVHQKNSPLKKAIDKTEEIIISYKESVFSFDFAALNYTSPDKNEYAYKLDGFDKEWTYTRTKKAIYTNLNPGKYTFKVKASNNDGFWNEEGTSINVIITPPFWKTWPFRIFAITMIVIAIYGFFLIRVRIINNQKTILQQEVTKQTAELIQQKAALEVEREESEKARQDAEHANQAKSIFLATMSHEIRTPMNGVLGMASLLAETVQTQEQQEYTATIRNSGEALLTIINDILDFSKIESDNLELDNQGFDLRKCIEEVMDVFSAKASEIGLDLLYQIDHNLPTQIIGDKYRLRQILINLISNAMKFTPKGEIFVGVELSKILNNNIEINFHVRDTGVGIPDDKLSRLFKAFSQVDSATNRKYGGTGLGLVISQRLVQLMGGTIVVESQPNVGTTFKFSIHTQINQEQIEPAAPQHLIGYEGKKVLLVDENTTSINVLKSQLEQWKLSVTFALSGKEALEILNEPNSFDLVIVDMQMPDMDGLQLAKLIKIKFERLPIILASSIGDEAKSKYPDLFAAVITKPVKQLQLLQDISAALKGAKPSGAIADGKQKYVLSADFASKFPLNILLAEDNPVNQKLAVRILNKLGYQHIAVAQNGLETLEKLSKRFYEVILMDMQMPEMDGLEATKMIRLKEQQQPIIIAMTANAMQGDRDLCLQAGMNEYLTKPVKLEVLMSALEKAAESFRLVAEVAQGKS